MMAKCQRCHQHEYAAWHAGPHSATYSDIFLNTAHNTKRQLMNDCFRCHGMYFDGAIGDMVQPVEYEGTLAFDASGTRGPGGDSLPIVPLGSSPRANFREAGGTDFGRGPAGERFACSV